MNGKASTVYYSALILVVAFVVLATGAIFRWVIPNKKLAAWNEATIQQLELVKKTAPENVPLEEWVFVVGWTQTAFPNVFYSTDYILEADRFHSFQQELEIRLARDVNVSTIQWIWEEFRANSPHGEKYSAGFYPLPPYGTVHLDADGNLRK